MDMKSGDMFKKYLEINIVHVKPKYFSDYVMASQKGVEIVKKFGEKILGHWMVEAGAEGPEIVYIAEWDSLQARANFRKKLLPSPEWQAYATENMKKARCVTNNITTAVPGWTIKDINPEGRYFLETFALKGNQMRALSKHMELAAEWEKKHGEGPVAFLSPVCSPNSPGMFTLMPANDPDKLMGQWKDHVCDPNNWYKLGEIFEESSSTSARLLTPVPKAP